MPSINHMETLQEFVSRELKEWQVSMYAKNSHLFLIPSERIEDQRELLIKQYRSQRSSSSLQSLVPIARDVYEEAFGQSQSSFLPGACCLFATLLIGWAGAAVIKMIL
jgi:hypothetical protein